MVPPPPPRLSTMTCEPNASVSLCDVILARISVVPPGGKGVIRRMGFVGYACAKALAAMLISAAIAAPAAAQRALRINLLPTDCLLAWCECASFCDACGPRCVELDVMRCCPSRGRYHDRERTEKRGPHPQRRRRT